MARPSDPSERGRVIAWTAISDVWAEARTIALTPEQFASPLAGRPYDLRHAAVSLWLNAGVRRTQPDTTRYRHQPSQHLESELTRTLDELDRTRIALTDARQAADRPAD